MILSSKFFDSALIKIIAGPQITFCLMWFCYNDKINSTLVYIDQLVVKLVLLYVVSLEISEPIEDFKWGLNCIVKLDC